MNEHAFVRPADGLKMRHPDGRHLAEDGDMVPLNSYWRRRIAGGELDCHGRDGRRRTGVGHADQF
jgi:hypothetical protein